MARLHDPSVEPVYAAAQQFVDQALRKDDSLFTPGQAIWSLPVLNDLHHRFVSQPHVQGGGFLERLRQQLRAASHETIQLAAELLFVHFLIALDVSLEKKRSYVTQVLQWSGIASTIPADFERALSFGLAREGTAFHAYRYEQLRYLLEFAQIWKQLREDERLSALEDPWEFETVVNKVRIGPAHGQRNALLHLVFPDAFEPIVSAAHKQKIASAFTSLVDDAAASVDRQIAQIREQLTPQYGSTFHFYRADVRQRWNPDTSAWGKLSAWAARFFYWSEFEEREREYKLEIAKKAQRARDAVLKGADDWLPLLKAALGPPNNLTHWMVNDRFLKWCTANPSAALAALRNFWDSSASISERIQRLIEEIPSEAFHSGNRLGLAWFFAFAVDPHKYPPYRATVFQRGYKLTSYPHPAPNLGPGPLYQHALEFLDQFMKELKGRRVEVRDRLDAQSLLWSVVSWPENEPPVSQWTEQERAEFLEYRTKKQVDDPKPSLEGLADRLLLDPDFLRRIEQLLEAKGQVIFYGPPGTGKTYVARELARTIVGDRGRVDVVQFHPSYAYEDFVEGYRPGNTDNGQAGFRLVDGPLKRAAAAAAADPDARHILIIDEINRGNLPKVFGELYFLLEYRDEQVSLQYSDKPFTLPPNLWLIGTMNTADRSIALLDAALRRRFYFVPFFPTEPPLDGLLRRWLERHNPDLIWIADVVNRANELLRDGHTAIGPSYFMKPGLDEDWVEIVWEHAIIPYLADRFYGNEERLKDFALEKLQREIGLDV